MTAGPPRLRMRGRWLEEVPGSRAGLLLAPVSFCTMAAIMLRAALYDRGLLRARRLGIPVVSIGNLTAGGTGKTPACLEVCALLASRGERPVVLSRGYRGRAGRNDEAELMGAVPVVCDPDRARGGARAIAEHGATVAVLDDGFQHRRLARDLDLVLIDATDPFGGGLPLPAGRLREPLRSLQRADLAWLTRCDLVGAPALAALQARVNRWCPSIRATQGPARLVSLDAAAPKPSPAAPPPLVLVSGIGNPRASSCRPSAPAGGCIGVALRWPDHHRYDARDLARIRAEADARGAQVALTAKDWVKLQHLVPTAQRAGWWLIAGAEWLPSESRARLEALLTERLARARTAAPASAAAASRASSAGSV